MYAEESLDFQIAVPAARQEARALDVAQQRYLRVPLLDVQAPPRRQGEALWIVCRRRDMHFLSIVSNHVAL